MSAVVTRLPRARGGPERYWQIIRANADAFTIRQIRDGVTPKVSHAAIRRYLRGLLREGVVAVAQHRPPPQPGGWPETVYRCLKPQLPTPVSRDVADSRHGHKLKQIWNTMRGLQQWTVDELVVFASTDDRAVSRRYCSNFVRAMEAHGLVRVVARKRGSAKGSTPAVYTLLPSANTGPKPPKVSRDGKGILDPNRRVRITVPTEVTA